MAIVRSIDNNNDFNFGNGRSDYVDNEIALRQNIITRLQEYKKDCFFDKNAGLDYDYYLSNKNTKDSLLKEVRYVILQTDDVMKINSINFSIVDRNILIVATISSIYGTIDINLNI
jgi:hypothetical protein